MLLLIDLSQRIYTHEAHPGEYYPHIESMEQRFTYARDLGEKLDVQRPILLDSLDGACHHAYESMPNMSWIFNQSNIPLYKSNRTDANSVENAVEYFIGVQVRRRSGDRLVLFYFQPQDLRNRDLDGFYKALEYNGLKAIREFRAVFG